MILHIEWAIIDMVLIVVRTVRMVTAVCMSAFVLIVAGGISDQVVIIGVMDMTSFVIINSERNIVMPFQARVDLPAAVRMVAVVRVRVSALTL